MRKKFSWFLLQKKVWKILLVLGAFYPALLFAPDVSAEAQLRGKIVVRPIKKSDSVLSGKRLNHPVAVGSEEMIEILQNLYFSRKLPVLWANPERIFDDRTVDLTAEHFRRKLLEVGPREIVRFTLNTSQGRTTGDVFALNGALNWRFSVIKGEDYLMNYLAPEQEDSGEILVNWKLAPQKKQDYFYKKTAIGLKFKQDTWITVPLKSLKRAKPERERSRPAQEAETVEDLGMKAKLRLLKELREENLISEEDYQQKVKDLLGEF